MATQQTLANCFICGEQVPSKVDDYNNHRQRYACPSCGEYQITNDAKQVYESNKDTLKDIVKKNQHLNTDETILDVAVTSGVTAGKR